MADGNSVAFNESAKVVFTLPEVDALTEQYHQDVRVENVNDTLAVVHATTLTHVGTLGGQVLADLLRETEPPASEGTKKLCSRFGRCVRKRCLIRKV